MENKTQAHTFLESNKFSFPLISFFVSLCAVLMIASLPGDLGYIVVALNIIVLWVCLFIPMLSFFYSKKILKNSSKRILYTLLNSFTICLPYLFLLMLDLGTWSFKRVCMVLIYMLVLLVWSEIWGLLGLIRKRTKENDEKQTDDKAIEEKSSTDEGEYKKILYPIMSFILSLFIEAVVFIPKSNYYSLIVNSVLLAWILLFMPIASFLYSKIILKNSRNKIVYTLLNSLAICLSYLFLLFLELHSYWIALGIFAWCEIWGLLGLIGKRDKKKDEIPSEQ